jgi:N-acetylglucosaminyl-diphospho-decaprenol L-rhamnosyltransferase
LKARRRRRSVSAIIINYNGGPDLIECLRSLQNQTSPPDEVIVVDNASSDGSLREAAKVFPRMIAIPNATNKGFAAAANIGAGAAVGETLLILNPDISLSSDCVNQLELELERAPGVVGPAVTLSADSNDMHGGTIDRFGYPTNLVQPGCPLYVSGSALATPRSLFLALGGFDERFFMFMEDIDYCWRVLLSGHAVSVCAEAIAAHRGGGSTPGGYIRSGKVVTTPFRFALRERNSLAMLLKCAPGPWLLWLIPAYVVKSFGLAAGALMLGHPELSRDLVGGLVWNARELRRTYILRRRIQRTNKGVRTATDRIYRGWLAWERFHKFGVPRIIDHTAGGSG